MATQSSGNETRKQQLRSGWAARASTTQAGGRSSGSAPSHLVQALQLQRVGAHEHAGWQDAHRHPLVPPAHQAELRGHRLLVPRLDQLVDAQLRRQAQGQG